MDLKYDGKEQQKCKYTILNLAIQVPLSAPSQSGLKFTQSPQYWRPSLHLLNFGRLE